MPVIRSTDAVNHQLHGSTFSSYVAPSRGSAELCAWRLIVPGGQEGTAHRPTREEVLLVLTGELLVTLDGVPNRLQPGDVALVPAGGELCVASGASGATAWVLGILHESGFEPSAALHIKGAVLRYCMGHLILRQALSGVRWRQLPKSFEHYRAVGPALDQFDPDEQFRIGLDALLSGLIEFTPESADDRARREATFARLRWPRGGRQLQRRAPPRSGTIALSGAQHELAH